MARTYHRKALKGETSRPIIRLNGRVYEPLASPSMISPGMQCLVQILPSECFMKLLPPHTITRSKESDQILVARVGTEGWERFEAQDI